MSLAFSNKVVVITGASSGIGKETALAFAHAGASVVLVARRGELLQQMVEEHPRLRLFPFAADITNPQAASTIVESTLQQFGRIDILVNNAGIGMRQLVTEVSMDDARRVMELNFFAVLNCTQAVLPMMRQQKSGQIINILSIVAAIAAPHHSIYSASKAAVRALSDALRVEVRQEGIDVISLLPGCIDTPFFESQIGGSACAKTIRPIPASRVAQAILKACRGRSREVTLPFLCRLGEWVKRLSPWFVDRQLRKFI